MYCPNCGHQNEQDAKFCINCGKALAGIEQTAPPSTSTPSPAPSQSGRGALILVLGILSVTVLGFIAGIPAWVMGNRDLKKIHSGTIFADQKGLTTAGRVLGIIGTLLTLGAVVATIAVVTITLITVRIASAGNNPQGLSAISPAYAGKATPLASYDNLEQIRGLTADDPPAIFLMQVSLGYDPKDKAISVEIGNRSREIQDLILKDISRKKAADLAPGNYGVVQNELKDQINSIMTEGKIQAVMFREFVVQK